LRASQHPSSSSRQHNGLSDHWKTERACNPSSEIILPNFGAFQAFGFDQVMRSHPKLLSVVEQVWLTNESTWDGYCCIHPARIAFG
jgi:hypothetical protein